MTETRPSQTPWLSRIARRWLAVVNLLAAGFVAFPLLAPVLMSLGWTDPALAIYSAYRLVCHQWAFRSYFLMGPQWTYDYAELDRYGGPLAPYASLGGPEIGYKVAFCERDLAIYLTLLLAGLAYVWLKARMRPLRFQTYLLLILPMALDGFSQLFGWRESTPPLRVLTGSLFSVASVWLIYPRVELLLDRLVIGRSASRAPIGQT